MFYTNYIYVLHTDLQVFFIVLIEFQKLKFMFSKKATQVDEIFTVDLMLCSKSQMDGEDFVNFRVLLRKYEL